MKLVKIPMENYVEVRGAMKNGARTIEDIKTMTSVDTDEYREDVETILGNVCRCKNVSLKEVVELVNSGTNTVDEIKEKTGAGTVCGRCVPIIENIIELKK